MTPIRLTSYTPIRAELSAAVSPWAHRPTRRVIWGICGHGLSLLGCSQAGQGGAHSGRPPFHSCAIPTPASRFIPAWAAAVRHSARIGHDDRIPDVAQMVRGICGGSCGCARSHDGRGSHLRRRHVVHISRGHTPGGQRVCYGRGLGGAHLSSLYLSNILLSSREVGRHIEFERQGVRQKKPIGVSSYFPTTE